MSYITCDAAGLDEKSFISFARISWPVMAVARRYVNEALIVLRAVGQGRRLPRNVVLNKQE
jgi:hypothetical protein